MENFFADNALSIGKTPLVKINGMAQGLKVTILGKIEGRNPSYSVKCRIGASMIWDGERGDCSNRDGDHRTDKWKHWHSLGICRRRKGV